MTTVAISFPIFNYCFTPAGGSALSQNCTYVLTSSFFKFKYRFTAQIYMFFLIYPLFF
jgi:hypothetical protein